MNFNKIPADTFDKLQLNAGVLLKSFTPTTGAIAEGALFAATTGGTSFRAQPTFEDFGADIDNAPKNSKELKRITDYTVTLSGTLLTIDEDTAVMLAAAADSAGGKITPRMELEDDDFGDLWWVGDYGKDDGFIAIRLINALSTGGFQIQSGDRAKGKFAFEFTAHFSMDTPDTVPYEIYIGEVTAA